MKKIFALIRTLINPRFALCLLMFITLIAFGYIAYSKSQSYISQDLESSFRNLIGINDINSSLRTKLISFKRDETNYWDPEIIIKVENRSNHRVFISTGEHPPVRAFLVGDKEWVEIFINSNVHLLNNGEKLTLYPKETSQPSSLLITEWPLLGYPTGYHTEGMNIKKMIRVLVRGEIISGEQRLSVAAYVDVPLR